MALRWVLATIVTLSSALALAKPLVRCADPGRCDSASTSKVSPQICNGLVDCGRLHRE